MEGGLVVVGILDELPQAVAFVGIKIERQPGHAQTMGLQRLIKIIDIWVVVKIMVPFWVPAIIRHLIFRVPKKGP